jgi:hypothetical protein
MAKPAKTLAEMAADAHAAAAEAGAYKGIECPNCGCKHWDTRRTVREEGRIKREKYCRNCGYPMVTFEQPDDATSSNSGKRPSRES